MGGSSPASETEIGGACSWLDYGLYNDSGLIVGKAKGIIGAHGAASPAGIECNCCFELWPGLLFATNWYREINNIMWWMNSVHVDSSIRTTSQIPINDLGKLQFFYIKKEEKTTNNKQLHQHICGSGFGFYARIPRQNNFSRSGSRLYARIPRQNCTATYNICLKRFKECHFNPLIIEDFNIHEDIA